MHFNFLSRPRWFVDSTVLNWEGSRKQGRKLTLQALELGTNDLPVILVAALGFFTGSYILYVSGAILPMIGFVYWHGETSSNHETAFNNITVAGAIVGMLFFGVFADLYGRRKLYGYELIVLMAGTMGLVMSSTGFAPVNGGVSDRSSPDFIHTDSIDFSSFGAMNIESWLFFWRFFSGVGIGGEYPLSAVIASEFAPTHTRPRMLALVFLMRPLGIAAGALVALIVTKVVSSHNPGQLSPDAQQRAVDQIWRWVIGLALVPAFLTAALRFTTPESPRYTLDVLDDPNRAFNDTDKLKHHMPSSTLRTRSSSSQGQRQISVTGKHERADLLENGEQDDSSSSPQITIKQYFWTEGNWRYLVATSVAWFLADFPRFADGLSNARTLSNLWYGVGMQDPSKPRLVWDTQPMTGDKQIFQILAGNSTRLLLMVSIASVLGAVLLVIFITRVNRRLLTWVMFLVSGCVYLLAGGVLQKTGGTGNSAINIALYAVIQFSNYFGIGPLTFLLPSELFPTKYRATCHGISAAFGKAGAVLASATLKSVAFGQIKESTDPSVWLGYVFMIFAIPMFIGAGVCWLWIPDLQGSDGESKTLENLALGRKPASEEE